MMSYILAFDIYNWLADYNFSTQIDKLKTSTSKRNFTSLLQVFVTVKELLTLSDSLTGFRTADKGFGKVKQNLAKIIQLRMTGGS